MSNGPLYSQLSQSLVVGKMNSMSEPVSDCVIDFYVDTEENKEKTWSCQYYLDHLFKTQYLTI